MRTPLFLALVLLLSWATPAAAGEVRAGVHHELAVVLVPAGHEVRVEDRVRFPSGLEGFLTEGGELRFLLHKGLDVASADEAYVVALDTETAPPRSSVPLRAWIARPASGTWPEDPSLRLRYSGTIDHALVSEGEEYARSFARTPGTISERGVVLTRATWWVPHFGEDLLTFDLAVELPAGWDAVSQGDRAAHEAAADRSFVAWHCPHPMEEVYLIANRWTVFERPAGAAAAYAYLRQPDANLANRYLEATALYLDMYQRLIGPYPFGKFALVENFWETGYGMPSFTLLGPRVIRMPFILHSSYPHEILHNWWGNSVYVDWETGNWCEGITAYLADHLVREGQGRGNEYRFDTLKTYRSYVRGERDFPLTDFRSRRSGATQAIGYGKSLMLMHMLRRALGDDAFRTGIRAFYRDQLWKQASFDDLRRVFSEVAGRDLAPFFRQWVERKGAPSLALDVVLGPSSDVVLTIRQTQEEEPYALTVPVAITLEGAERALVVPVDLEERETRLAVPVPARPLRVDLDPEFDVFRRLDVAETPPTLSELFGADAVTLVVPATEGDEFAGAWRELAETWRRSGGGQVDVVAEDGLEALPDDRAVWVLGSENRWQEVVKAGLAPYGASVGEAKVEFGETSVARGGHSFVLTVRHPGNPELAIGWVGSRVGAALPGLGRKLPHYGRYSYLAFTGDEPSNVVKGQWPAAGSPLVALLAVKEGEPAPERGLLPEREPLARLEPAFDEERLLAHVSHLADDRLQGRGVGDATLDEAAVYVAKGFEAAGLVPGGYEGSYYQSFDVPGGPEGKVVTLRNVVGVLPGTKEEWASQSVVVGAHYDHLGRGWPDVREGNEGKVHNGADDNASGVAVLLELARTLARETKPDRSVVFVAFSGEEWGRKGSRHYAAAKSRRPARDAIAMVNLDTVGRLGDAKLLVLGSGTAREWPHVAMGVGYTTGVESTCVAEDLDASDQVSFEEVGVPAIQLFTGGHADYHRPSDTVDKVDAKGLVKVATFAREVVVYLTQRPDPLTRPHQAGQPKPPAEGPRQGRRVSVGTVPAFQHRGPGVKVASVIPGSAAEAAGIQAGDVLTAADGEAMKDLRAYQGVLKQHEPGDKVRFTVQRGEATLDVEVTLRAR